MEDDLLKNLNTQQKEVVTTTEGYIRVIAGAGSGKTKALTHRYAYLVNEVGISTSNILCVTFTNKAAGEMKRRIEALIGDNPSSYIATFHGFCVSILKEDIHVLHYPNRFMILDNEDMESIFKIIFEDMNINSKHMTFEMVSRMISFRKEKGDYVEEIINTDNEGLRKKALQAETIEDGIWYRYLYEQKKCYGLDFSDLLNFVLYIFSHHESVQRKWQERLQYIMVDEFQDVSGGQYHFAKLLSEYHHNLLVVGDPDQTIYSWRGANVGFIMDFDKKFPEVNTIFLNQNYRSTPNILNVSNSLIKKNKMRIDKELIPVKKVNVPVYYYHAKTSEEEGKWIVDQIKALQEKGRKLSEMAVLYRSHYVSRSVEEACIKAEIPYVLYSGMEFYKRKEIKDVLCYLRMLTSSDDISLLRVINEPKRNIGPKRIKSLKEYAISHDCSLYQALLENKDEELFVRTKANEFIDLVERYKKIYNEMSISDLLARILNDSGYEEMLRLLGDQDRLDNLAEFKQSIVHFENEAQEDESLEEYLARVALFTNLDQEERKERVKMMTIHTAKGLEFPIVFVCGLNEGIFPTKRTDTKEKLEEERRLAYVAYTRAEEGLFLSDAEGESHYGGFRYPSRFIFNIEKEFIDYVVELPTELALASARYIEEDEKKYNAKAGFQKEDRVLHKIFGEGTITDIDTEHKCYLIQFDKFDTVRSINMNIALEKI